jgi:hypothetical protein
MYERALDLENEGSRSGTTNLLGFFPSRREDTSGHQSRVGSASRDIYSPSLTQRSPYGAALRNVDS